MDLKINKEKLKKILDNDKVFQKNLYERMVNDYGFEIDYKSFNKLVNNNVTWKLSYAIALIEILEVELYDLFDWTK